MKIGSVDIAAMKVGAANVSKVYQGATEIAVGEEEPWTPASIPDLELWLINDASTMWRETDSLTTPAAVDARVGTWLDQSGQNNHMTSVGNTRRFTLRSDGSNLYNEAVAAQLEEMAASGVPLAWLALAAFETDTNADFARIADHANANVIMARRTSGSDQRLIGPTDAEYWAGHGGSVTGPHASASHNNPLPYSDPRVILMEWPTPLTAGELVLAGQSGSNANNVDLGIYSVLAGSSALGAGDRSAAIAYLAGRAGVSLE